MRRATSPTHIGEREILLRPRQLRASDRCGARPLEPPRGAARTSPCSSRAGSGCASRARSSTPCSRSQRREAVDALLRPVPGRRRRGRWPSCARRLDNLPLARRVGGCAGRPPSRRAQILERLSGRLDLFKGGRDADPRQQTLRATMEWSYQLLASRRAAAVCLARRLSRRLARSRPPRSVCQARMDTLQSLVDKNLLRHTGERFSMLETIHEYAAERLEASGDADELRRRHAEHFLDTRRGGRAATCARDAVGEWLDRLDRDQRQPPSGSRLARELRPQRARLCVWREHSGGSGSSRAPAEGWRRLESALSIRTRARQRPARRLSTERRRWQARSAATRPRPGFKPRRRSRSIVRWEMRGAPPTPYSCGSARRRESIWQQRSSTTTRAHDSSASSVTSTTRC